MTHVSKAMCAMLALALSLLAPGLALAQSQATTAEINGRLTDANGGVLPGVTVTATSPDTGYTREVVTNGEGLFSLPLLPPGLYDVTAELSGFATFRQTVRATVGATVTLNPTADATLDRGQSNTNFGASPDLRLRNSGQTSCQSVLRFNVPAFSGTVLSARLRCFYSDGSNVAGIVYRTSGTWTETGVNYSNRPKPVGSQLASQGTVANGAWAEFDVTAAVTGPGAVNLLMQSNSQNLAVFSSREGATPPQLVVTTQPQ